MVWNGLFGEYDRYTVEFTPETPDLYWYYFSVTGRTESSYICGERAALDMKASSRRIFTS